eukprot:3058507-Pyramimonas_sp.AAC.2
MRKHVGVISKRASACSGRSACTLSKAFRQSNAKKDADPLRCARASARCLLAMKMASSVQRLERKPHCDGQMRLSSPASRKRCFDMLANNR